MRKTVHKPQIVPISQSPRYPGSFNRSTVLLLLSLLHAVLTPYCVAQQADIELPDPLILNDGTPVTDAQTWAQRKAEMRAALLGVEYGHPPNAVPDTILKHASPVESKNEGLTSFQTLELATGPNAEIPITVHLYSPAQSERPCPIIVRIGLGCPIIDEINRRGYAVACFDNKDLDPDEEGKEVRGPAQTAYPEQDWASLAVWAWGASRALDHLATLKDVDVSRAVVTGHSRTGKAALLAGALDERFQFVVPNGSGCGGAAAYRVYNKGAETLRMITLPGRFAYWFHSSLRNYAGREAELPLDQHFLRALVAPRAVLSTDARGDAWANILGTQVAHQAAQPVFDFLGVPKRNALHLRDGGHDQLAEDIRVLLDYADWLFEGAPWPSHDGLKAPSEQR